MIVEQLGTQVKMVAPLVDIYKRGDVSFAERVIDWLEKTESLMSKLHLKEGGEMSVLRSKILKFSDVYRPSVEKPTQSMIRKGRLAEAAAALERAEEILRVRIRESEERLSQFENKLCEGLTAFLLENTFPENNGNYMAWLNLVWSMIRNQPSTRALAIYISASLVSYDRTYILENVISRLTDEELRKINV